MTRKRSTTRSVQQAITDFVLDAKTRGIRTYRNAEITPDVEERFWAMAHARAVAQFGTPDPRLSALWIEE